MPFGSPGCKWPVGGEGVDMMCCGADRIVATPERPSPPYCAEHTDAAKGAQPRTHHQRKVFHNIGRKKVWAA